MAKNAIQTLIEKAERLRHVRSEIKRIRDERRKELDLLELEDAALEEDLIASLDKNGLATIKASSGDRFTKVVKPRLDIVSEAHALKWAMEHHAVNINKAAVAQLLKDRTELPDGFQRGETTYINITKPKEAKDEVEKEE